MHFQDFATASAVRAVNQHLSVKSSGTQQCGIKHLWAIGRGDQNYAGAGIKPIQFGEQLIERLLLFVIAAERAGHNRAANIARARQLFAMPQSAAQHNINPAAESDQPCALPKPCPCCGGRMIIIETFARGCQPKYTPASIRIDSS